MGPEWRRSWECIRDEDRPVQYAELHPARTDPLNRVPFAPDLSTWVITPPDIILSMTARLNANETQERNWALHVRKRSGSGLVLGWNWAVSGMPKIAVCDR